MLLLANLALMVSFGPAHLLVHLSGKSAKCIVSYKTKKPTTKTLSPKKTPNKQQTNKLGTFQYALICKRKKKKAERFLWNFEERRLLEKGRHNSHPHPELCWKGMKEAIRILCNFEEININLK